MVENKLPSGVGKKIVQALKKQQSSIEIQTIPDPIQEKTLVKETIAPVESFEEEIITDNISLDEGFSEFAVEDNTDEDFEMFEETQEEEQQEEFSSEFDDNFSVSFEDEIETSTFDENEMFATPQSIKGATAPQVQQKSYAVPANVAVLKRLIMQLPQGVTKQTGAQIIRQTMEALGISMGNVLKEAQQGQDSLTASAKACLSTIAEYKNNIRSLEKQVQDYKKQAIALNDLINLFLMTDKR